MDKNKRIAKALRNNFCAPPNLSGNEIIKIFDGSLFLSIASVRVAYHDFVHSLNKSTLILKKTAIMINDALIKLTNFLNKSR